MRFDPGEMYPRFCKNLLKISIAKYPLHNTNSNHLIINLTTEKKDNE